MEMRKRYKKYIIRTIMVILIAMLAAIIAARRNNGFETAGGGDNVKTSEPVRGDFDDGAGGDYYTAKSSETDSRGVVKKSENKDSELSKPSKSSKPADDGKNIKGNAYVIPALSLSDYEKLSIDPLSPELYEGAALKSRMKELAELDKTYKKVYKNYDDYPENVLAAYCNEPGMSEFVLGYTVRKGRVGEPGETGYTEDEMEDEFPLLLQWDKRWGYESYGDSCIGLAGCAPVCLAMVSLAVTHDEENTPDKIAAYAMEQGYYLRGTGTLWSFLTEGAKYFGLSGRELGMSESAVMSELEAGHPVICSMRPGTFTVHGHFIVLAGLRDGRIIVRDPNSPYRSSLLWDFSDIKGEIKNMWSYTVPSRNYKASPEYGDSPYGIVFDIRD